ncbi:MAG TPA: methionine biosynthesis protein MetW [Candidatus Kapabacteria bacterium]|nr:methionine biosynthesis protein MetW [Candidatus Kapabacteria bacterium]
MTEKLPYDFDLRLDDPVSTHAIQFRLVPGGSRVLDIGCHTGILGAALQIHKHCEVTGIDNDKTALAIASERLHETNLVNLEIPGWSKALGNSDRFDVLLFGDVIEHTREPQRIIEESLGLLKQGGIAIISLPNIANLRVRLNLLFGKFIYSDAGILDWSHLRFFTL